MDMKKGTCDFAGRVFSEEEKICEDGKCFTCVDGEWKDAEQSFSSSRSRQGLVIAPGEDLSDM